VSVSVPFTEGAAQFGGRISSPNFSSQNFPRQILDWEWGVRGY